MKEFKNNVFPWIRINRVIRDIPNLNIKGGNENVNLRETLLKRPDINCNCNWRREVKNRTENIDKAELLQENTMESILQNISSVLKAQIKKYSMDLLDLE